MKTFLYVVALAAVLTFNALLVVACSRPSTQTTDQVAASAQQLQQQTPDVGEAARTMGPDICRVQSWGALAFNMANERDIDQAPYDRVAWNLAQYHVARILQENPNADKTATIRAVEKILREVYQTPQITECDNP